MPRPTVTTLCGSTRFREQFEQANRALTLAGEIVISVGLFGHREAMDMEGDTKRMLDELHLQKIAISDGIYVVNPGGYVGSSTRREIAYAVLHGKTLRSLEPLTTELATPGGAAREDPSYPMSELGRLLARNEKLEAKLAHLVAWWQENPDRVLALVAAILSNPNVKPLDGEPSLVVERAAEIVAEVTSNAQPL